jgi:hypothetical protein
MFNNDDAMTINATIPSAMILRNNNLTYYFVPFYDILFLIGTFGNGLVIISIYRSSRLRTVTNTYLLNIAIADFLLLLSIPFLIVTILANGWIFGNVLCKMYYNFIHINQYVSSLLLAALSFDRYLAVCHPIRAIEFRTRTKCVLIITGMLIIEKLMYRYIYSSVKDVGLYPAFFFVQHGYSQLSRPNAMWSGLGIEYKSKTRGSIFSLMNNNNHTLSFHVLFSSVFNYIGLS